MEAKIAERETFLVVVKAVVKSFCFPLSRYFFNLFPVNRVVLSFLAQKLTDFSLNKMDLSQILQGSKSEFESRLKSLVC